MPTTTPHPPPPRPTDATLAVALSGITPALPRFVRRPPCVPAELWSAIDRLDDPARLAVALRCLIALAPTPPH